MTSSKDLFKERFSFDIRLLYAYIFHCGHVSSADLAVVISPYATAYYRSVPA